MPRWRVSGLIVADQLPTAPLRLLECTIAPLDHPRSTPDVSSPFSLTPAPGFSGTTVMASPPHIKFEAQHSITTIVEGDELDLREAARLRFARCLGAVCFASNPLAPGVVQEIRWERLQQGVPGQGPDAVVESGEWGASAAIMPAVIGPLTTQTATNLRALEAMAGEAWEKRSALAGHPSQIIVEAGHANNARSAAGSHLQAFLSHRSGAQ